MQCMCVASQGWAAQFGTRSRPQTSFPPPEKILRLCKMQQKQNKHESFSLRPHLPLKRHLWTAQFSFCRASDPARDVSPPPLAPLFMQAQVSVLPTRKKWAQQHASGAANIEESYSSWQSVISPNSRKQLRVCVCVCVVCFIARQIRGADPSLAPASSTRFSSAAPRRPPRAAAANPTH